MPVPAAKFPHTTRNRTKISKQPERPSARPMGTSTAYVASGARNASQSPKNVAPARKIKPEQSHATSKIVADKSFAEKLREQMDSLAGKVEQDLVREANNVRALPSEIESHAQELLAGSKVDDLSRTQQDFDDVGLGIDFGTSSTKIVARFPYKESAPAFALGVPPCAQSDAHPHLWASRLWLAPDGHFSLLPVSEGKLLCGLKANMLRSDCERRIALVNGNSSATALEAATAFLALQIRRARGWLKLNRSINFCQKPIRWSYTVGFPAASLDKPDLRRRYEYMFAAAILLSQQEGDVTAARTRKMIQEVGAAASAPEEIGGGIATEIQAAVMGFLRSKYREDGLFSLVDVGASTVDCCTFNVYKTSSGDKCSIFSADVSLLGTQPWQVARRQADIEQEFIRRLKLSQRTTIWQTYTNKYPSSERWSSGLPVFLVGGGSLSDVHRNETNGLNDWLRGQGKSGAKIMEMPVAAPLDYWCDRTVVHRLAVAIGLSWGYLDLPEVELPSAIDDLEPRRIKDIEAAFTSKDAV